MRPSFLHSLCLPPCRCGDPLTPPVVYGVVDLYGMAVKVTIVHNNNHSDRRANNAILRALSPEGALRRAAPTTQAEPERLLFHPNCGAEGSHHPRGTHCPEAPVMAHGVGRSLRRGYEGIGGGEGKWEAVGVWLGASWNADRGCLTWAVGVGWVLQC